MRHYTQGYGPLSELVYQMEVCDLNRMPKSVEAGGEV